MRDLLQNAGGELGDEKVKKVRRLFKELGKGFTHSTFKALSTFVGNTVPLLGLREEDKRGFPRGAERGMGPRRTEPVWR